MSDNPTEQVLDDLFRYMELLETQNAAILQFLKDKNVIKEKQFASYLEQAAASSEVKWRAARVRMEHLFAAAPEPKAEPSENRAKESPRTEHTTEEDSQQVSGKSDDSVRTVEKTDAATQSRSGEQGPKPATSQKAEERPTVKPAQVEAGDNSGQNAAKSSAMSKENAKKTETEPSVGQNAPADDHQKQDSRDSAREQGSAPDIEGTPVDKSKPEAGKTVPAESKNQANKPEPHGERDAA